MTIYNPSHFVGREKTIQELLTSLVQPTTDPRYKRNIVIEAPAQSGKSWLLEKMHEVCSVHPTQPIVLFISADELKTPSQNPRSLFDPIVDRLWQQVHSRLASLTNNPPFPNRVHSAAQDSIKTDLGALVAWIHRVAPAQLVIICFDGMEEVPLPVTQTADDLLYLFEDTCLVPLLRKPYYNVRLLASRRVDGLAPWRSFTLRGLTRIIKLELFTADVLPRHPSSLDPAEAQFQLVVTTNGVPVAWSFTNLRAELPLYTWDNPGANAKLMVAALQSPTGQLNRADLDICIDSLLAAPHGPPLPQTPRQDLERLVIHFPHLNTGVPIIDIGSFLGMNDYQRNTFLTELYSRGIVSYETNRLVVVPEIVALIQEAQRRPTP